MIDEALEINIKGPPPAQEVLAKHREQTAEKMSVIRRRERWFEYSIYAIVAITLANCIVFGRSFCNIFTYILPAHQDLFYLEGEPHIYRDLILWRDFMIYFFNHFLIWAVAISVPYMVYEKLVDSPKRLLKNKIRSLKELNVDQIIEYKQLISSIPEVKKYFRGLRAMGRKPIVAELEASNEFTNIYHNLTPEEDLAKLRKQASENLGEVYIKTSKINFPRTHITLLYFLATVVFSQLAMYLDNARGAAYILIPLLMASMWRKDANI